MGSGEGNTGSIKSQYLDFIIICKLADRFRIGNVFRLLPGCIVFQLR